MFRVSISQKVLIMVTCGHNRDINMHQSEPLLFSYMSEKILSHPGHVYEGSWSCLRFLKMFHPKDFFSQLVITEEAFRMRGEAASRNLKQLQMPSKSTFKFCSAMSSLPRTKHTDTERQYIHEEVKSPLHLQLLQHQTIQ